MNIIIINDFLNKSKYLKKKQNFKKWKGIAILQKL